MRVVPELSIVVPVYGRFDLLESCLASLSETTELEHEVLVVDDATLGGPPVVPPNRGTVLCRSRNGGFAAASNTGIARSIGRLVAIINSDAEVSAGWDTVLRKAVDGGAGVAAACQLDEGGTVVEAGIVVGHDGHVVLGHVGSDIADVAPAAVVPAVGAACMMALRSDLARWGGFSKAYGLGYYEDVDLSLLLSRLGLRCVVMGDARVKHVGQGSFKPADVERRLRVGRAVLTRRRLWELRPRPTIHGWEIFHARRAYALSHGCAGRAILIGDQAQLHTLIELLTRCEIAVHVVTADEVGESRLKELPHWADVAIGMAQDLERMDVAMGEHQPRAVPIEVGLDLNAVVDACAANGLGRERVGSGETVSVGLSRCRSVVYRPRDEAEIWASRDA